MFISYFTETENDWWQWPEVKILTGNRKFGLVAAIKTIFWSRDQLTVQNNEQTSETREMKCVATSQY